jgi:hypothetical protein
MPAPKLVANGKQPVAMAVTRASADVHPRSVQVSEILHVLAFDPAWTTERYIGYRAHFARDHP